MTPGSPRQSREAELYGEAYHEEILSDPTAKPSPRQSRRDVEVRTTVTLPPDLWQRFKEVADSHYRSRTEHMRFLIWEAVKQHDAANDPAKDAG